MLAARHWAGTYQPEIEFPTGDTALSCTVTALRIRRCAQDVLILSLGLLR